jgi:hypothetical protein
VLRFGIFTLSALATSLVLGLLVGFSFFWAETNRAWDHMITGFLWVLLVAAAMGLGRFMRERVRRGEWRRSLSIAAEMTFPTTTLYLIGVAIASAGAGEIRPDLLPMVPVYYSIALVVALFLGPFCMFTSPFRHAPVELEHQEPEVEQRAAEAESR